MRNKLIIDKAKNNSFKWSRNYYKLESQEIADSKYMREYRKQNPVNFKIGTYLPITPYGSINEICEND